MELPADGHVHSEWSWDAPHGSQERTCARAVELGLPVVAFTEHVEHTPVAAPPGSPLAERFAPLVGADGTLRPPPLDVAGYLDGVERCRARFPDVRVLSGMELGEPHRHPDAAAAVLAAGTFDRVLGSLHTLDAEGSWYEPPELFARWPAGDVARAYLAELAVLVETSDRFHVLAHVDYFARYWPEGAGRYDPLAFEAEFRHVLTALAATDRPLEINTVRPLDDVVVRWWAESGGTAVTFGSDAHDPDTLGRGLAAAAGLARTHGFEPDRRPELPWRRR